MVVLFSKCMALVDLNIFPFTNVSAIIDYMTLDRHAIDKMINSKISLCLDKFYMFCVHVMYSPCM